MMFALLIACGTPDGPYARVTAEGGAPVPVPRDLTALLVETTPPTENSGAAWIYLLDEGTCDEALAAPGETGSEDWLLYERMGLAFEISFDSWDGSVVLWEDTYWGGGAFSPSAQRDLQAWVFGDGRVYALDGGWLTLDEHGEAEASGSFEVPWYAGEFTAQNCGYASGGGDAGDTG